MPFEPDTNHQVTFEEGAELTATYRKTMSAGMHLGGYFNREAIEELFEQTGCVGIRIYYGLTEDGTQELVIVGVDRFGNDQIGPNFHCMDMYAPCPSICSQPNILNS